MVKFIIFTYERSYRQSDPSKEFCTSGSANDLKECLNNLCLGYLNTADHAEIYCFNIDNTQGDFLIDLGQCSPYDVLEKLAFIIQKNYEDGDYNCFYRSFSSKDESSYNNLYEDIRDWMLI